MDTSILCYFLAERESIRRKRALGLPAPWTDDRILREWSLTNVRREDDRTTRHVAVNWREPHRNDPDLFFAMTVAVFVNNIATLEELGWPVPSDPDRFLSVMKARAERGERLYGPAYMIRADKRYPTTAEYQAAQVFNPLWRDREWMRPRAGETLGGYRSRLGERHGFGGGFMPGQVIAYLKYAPPLCDAPDWATFVISGPGSRRGLNRVFGHPPDRKWPSEAAWRAAFNQLRAAITPDLERMGLGDLHASDLQSVLCELDKYERVRLGEGKPRRRFQPSPDPLPGSIENWAAE
jgi:hypothetical protein